MEKNINMKKLMTQIIKFGAVGFLCFFIDYGIMVALVELAGFQELIASGCSFTVSVVVNYILSVTIVFDADKDANKAAQFLVFVILSLIGLGINQLIMKMGISWLEQYMNRAYMVVKIFATGVVMVYNFITRKIFIEKKPQK
ncbi:MAG: GtrA family protein [Lachnospiraceae bacterium]|nr:GtrA family protein [Lachnospiraceae bacterium]